MSEEPELGTIVRGKDIGKTSTSKFIWARCPDCHEERWAHYSPRINNGTLRICRDCAIGRAKQNFYVGTGLEHKQTYKRKEK